MQIIANLHRAHQIAGDIFDDVAKNKFGDDDRRTRTQALVLAHLAEHSGQSQVEITAATGVDRSTLADVMRRLHKRGLVHRTRSCKDRRAWACELTAAGAQAALAAKMVAEQVEVELVKRIPSITKLRIPAEKVA